MDAETKMLLGRVLKKVEKKRKTKALKNIHKITEVKSPKAKPRKSKSKLLTDLLNEKAIHENMHDYAREQKDKKPGFKTDRTLSHARNKIKLMAKENGVNISEDKIEELALDLSQEMVSGNGTRSVNAKLVRIEDDMKRPPEVEQVNEPAEEEQADESTEVKQVDRPAAVKKVKRIKKIRKAKNKNKTPARNKNKTPDTELKKTEKRGEQDNNDEDVQATVRRSNRASRIDRQPENKEQVAPVSPKARRQLDFNDEASPGGDNQAGPVRPVAPAQPIAPVQPVAPPAGHEENMKATSYAIGKPYVLAVRNSAGDNSKNIYVKDYDALKKVMVKFDNSFLRTNKGKGDFYKQSNLLKYIGGKPVTINGQEYSLREFNTKNQEDMNAATSLKLYEKDVASVDQSVNDIIQVPGLNQQEQKEREQKDAPAKATALSREQRERMLNQRRTAIEREQGFILNELHGMELQVKNLSGHVIDQEKLKKQLEPKRIELSKRFEVLKKQNVDIQDMIMERKPFDLSSVQDKQTPQVPQEPQVPQDGKLLEHAQIPADKQNAPPEPQPDALALLDNRIQTSLIDRVNALDQEEFDATFPEE